MGRSGGPSGEPSGAWTGRAGSIGREPGRSRPARRAGGRRAHLGPDLVGGRVGDVPAGERCQNSEIGVWGVAVGADLIGLIGTAADRAGREATSGGAEGRIGRLLGPIPPARPGSTDARGLAGRIRMGLDRDGADPGAGRGSEV
jgi:hypothetical protein